MDGTDAYQRVDASDIIQEAKIEVFERLDEFLARRPMPFRIWLRRMAAERHRVVRKSLRAGRRAVSTPAKLRAECSAAAFPGQTNADLERALAPSPTPDCAAASAKICGCRTF